MADQIARWIRRHDPELLAVHRALRLAIVVTIAFGIATTISDNPQFSVFTAFGAVAVLLFADFPGNRQTRLTSYLMLVVIGASLIVAGTLASEVGWVAVASMAVVGFVVTFAGVLSSAFAAGTRAALLAFILPVTVPSDAADIAPRLAGWALAALLAVPAVMLMWPPREHDELRSKAAAACRALAAQLRDVVSGGSRESQVEARQLTYRFVDELRLQFRGATYRPVALTTGSRLLSQLVDQLDWVRTTAVELPERDHSAWPARESGLVVACADVLDSCAETVAAPPGTIGEDLRQQLLRAIDRLDETRRMAMEQTRPEAVRESLGEAELVHELIYTTRQVGGTVAASVAADSRSLTDRLIGRRDPVGPLSAWTAVPRIASRRLSLRSVWLHSSIRAAIGLALAVLIADVTHVGHSFWVVLAAMSILRTTALSTGASAARALLGTVAGFVVGAFLVDLLGTTDVALWGLLPIALLVAGFAPSAISFAAGQAAFTVLVVVLFNIVDPVGWEVGLVRIEDVALGCLAALVCGLFLWPEGAGAQIRRALAESFRSSADGLAAATRRVVEPSVEHDVEAGRSVAEAAAAAGRLDDAFREYLAERGSKVVGLGHLTAASNSASKLGQAAAAIFQATMPGKPDDAALRQARARLTEHAEANAQWYLAVSALLEGSSDVVPEPSTAGAAEAVHDALDPASAEAGATLWSVGLHLDSMTRLQSRLAPHLAEISRVTGRLSGGAAGV